MTDIITVAVYKDTTGLFTEEEILEDNIMDIELPEGIVKRYFIECCLKDFRGKNDTASEDKLYQECMSVNICDDMDGLVHFARENGWEVKR